MKEIWKDVVILDGRVERDYYKGEYQVSNLGKVKSIKHGEEKILKGSNNGKGYICLYLQKNNLRKNFKIHRLVAMAFLEDSYFDGAEIDHIDTVKDNNIVENLRWCTSEENMNNILTKKRISNVHKGKTLSESHKGRISESNKRKVICITTMKIFNSIIEASEYYGCDKGHISCCCRGKRKSCGKLEDKKLAWKYLDEYEYAA